MTVHPGRVFVLKQAQPGPGPVLYWMHREHRAADNWGLLHARQTARAHKRPLVVAHCLAPDYPGATLRSFAFLLRGLAGTAQALAAKGIPLLSLAGDPATAIPGLAAELEAAALVTDFDPLRHKQAWVAAVAAAAPCPVHEVDSRNVVPCRQTSQKKEWAARTIRPKIHRLLPEYMDEFPELEPQSRAWHGSTPRFDPESLLRRLRPDPSVPEARWITPGEESGLAAAMQFIDSKMNDYSLLKNDPNNQCTSMLSPFLHFGQLSAQRVALEAAKRAADRQSRDAFLEELIVRRELADNFCLHEQRYDSVDGFPDWARRSLDKHRGDARPSLYPLDELEGARTHDPLWNAAQRQMTITGHMHGWLRMYWAKKILEWTPSPEAAMEAAVRLNDRWQLDGRDPNGYTGIAWSLGGVHDRPWAERPVFGTLRCMTLDGARKKIDVQRFASLWGESGGEAGTVAARGRRKRKE